MAGFRHDINGLRALAVVGVLLFHLGVPFARGGYVGVDVFFVISGFLMTQIILGRMGEGTFSLRGFYGARVRRIVPALVAMCAVLLAVGVVALDPLSYQDLADDALASVLFVSNFLYPLQQRYFAPPAQEIWLLHTWSLSVEWQFYILYPLGLILLSRWRVTAQRIGPILVAATVLSFAATVAGTAIDPRYVRWGFYLLPFRAWEMLLGTVVAIYGERFRPKGAAGSAMAAAGLLLILGSAAAMAPMAVWPSAWTAVPVAGTALVLLAARTDSGWAKLPGVQAVGLWSYSIYLWHWPVLVALRREGVVLDAVSIAAAFAAFIVLGMASYHLAEVGLRRRLFERRGMLVQVAVVASVCALAAGAFASQGFESARLSAFSPERRAEILDYRAALDDWAFEEVCRRQEADVALCWTGARGPARVLVIGDSHAQQLAVRYADAPRAIAFATYSGCPYLPGIGRLGSARPCQAALDAAFRLAAEGGYERVIIAAAWPLILRRRGDGRSALCLGPPDDCRPIADSGERERAMEAGLAELSRRIAVLEAHGIEVVVLLSLPWRPGPEPSDFYKAAFRGEDDDGRRPYLARDYAGVGEVEALMRRAAEAGGAEVVDPLPHICPRGVCPVEYEGRYLFKDVHHYRASVMKAPMFAFLDRYLLPSPR